MISPTAFFKFPEHIDIGDGTFIHHPCSMWASERGHIHIGRNVLLGYSVTMVSSNHGIAAGELIREQLGVPANSISMGVPACVASYRQAGGAA